VLDEVFDLFVNLDAFGRTTRLPGAVRLGAQWLFGHESDVRSGDLSPLLKPSSAMFLAARADPDGPFVSS